MLGLCSFHDIRLKFKSAECCDGIVNRKKICSTKKVDQKAIWCTNRRSWTTLNRFAAPTHCHAYTNVPLRKATKKPICLAHFWLVGKTSSRVFDEEPRRCRFLWKGECEQDRQIRLDSAAFTSLHFLQFPTLHLLWPTPLDRRFSKPRNVL